MEVTCRTFQARLLLRPSPLLREITLGALGRAQRLHGVEIHAFVFLSNHYHLLVSVRDADQLARFMGHLNSKLAREVGRLHAWREKVWGRRYEPIVVTEEEAAQVGRLLYLMRQGCKEGLVADPLEWPGATSLPASVEGQSLVGTWFDRTSECVERRRGTELTERAFACEEVVVLSPLPAWAGLGDEERSRRLCDLLDLVKAESTAQLAQDGCEPLGPEAIARQDPHRTPDHVAQGPAPLVHAASRVAREAYREAYRFFVGAFRRAAEELRSGIATPAFPAGCFPPAGRFIRFAPA